MKIINKWDDIGVDGTDVYFTVELADDEFVDVKYPNMHNRDYVNSYSYVMECANGLQVYSTETNEDGIGIRELSHEEEDNIIEFVGKQEEK